MRIRVPLLVCALLLPPTALAATDFPSDSSQAAALCHHSGLWLSRIAADRMQGTPETVAADAYYQRRRTYGRVGSHLPTKVSRDEARSLTAFVYRFPALPKDVFHEVGVFQCEISTRLPRDKTGDVMPLVAVNAERCLQRLGDGEAAPDGPGLLGNERVYNCVANASKAIWQKLAGD